MYAIMHIAEPNTIEEALISEHAKEWKEAADSEYKLSMKSKIWELVEFVHAQYVE